MVLSATRWILRCVYMCLVDSFRPVSILSTYSSKFGQNNDAKPVFSQKLEYINTRNIGSWCNRCSSASKNQKRTYCSWSPESHPTMSLKELQILTRMPFSSSLRRGGLLPSKVSYLDTIQLRLLKSRVKVKHPPTWKKWRWLQFRSGKASAAEIPGVCWGRTLQAVLFFFGCNRFATF